ncbi:MAG: hypothetical protein ACPGO3_07580 [Magnetospiraceae bacterium]
MSGESIWTEIVLDPIFPVWVLALLLVAALLPTGVIILRGGRGGWLRLLAVVAVFLALCDPALVRERRVPQQDIAVVIVDESASQKIGSRPAQSAALLTRLEKGLARFAHLETRVFKTDGGAGGGTALMSALRETLASVPPERLAGIFAITDGAVHDLDQAPAFNRPFHALLTGDRGEVDRRLVVEDAAAFALVGEQSPITLRVEDPGSAPVLVRARAADGTEVTQRVAPNRPVVVDLPIDRPGERVFEFSVAPLAGEITTRNNRAVLSVRGVHDRLRVLLVSGKPHPGERAWRNLLKSDPSVDLIHFTILRPPGKGMFIPTRELSLIRFPVVELFDEKLDEFDLIIFDRYIVRHLLPPRYFANVVDYVENGGALLVTIGDEINRIDSLAATPLASVLLAETFGTIQEGPFRPTVTDMGRRHPVTAAFQDAAGWGRLYRIVAMAPRFGNTLIEGPNGMPLIQVARRGEGRVAQINTDQLWLWARGHDGGGPFNELNRRVAHWLMREPALEEEALTAEAAAGALQVTRRTMGETFSPVTITDPAGNKTTLTLAVTGAGVASANLPVTEQGLYQIADGTQEITFAMGEAQPQEFADPLATEDRLAPLAEASGGRAAWLGAEEATTPIRLRRVRPNAPAAGGGSGAPWFGLVENGGYTVAGISRQPMFFGLLAAAALLLIVTAAWVREGR